MRFLKSLSILLCIMASPGVLSADETFPQIASFGTTGSGESLLIRPYGISVDTASDSIYVADTGNCRIKKFNLYGDFLESFGANGSGDRQFDAPQGVLFDAVHNVIYVVDTGNHRIQKFTIDGNTYTFSLAFGSEGNADGQLYLPRDMDIGPDGNLYILDSGNGRIQKFSPSGEWLSTIGEAASMVNPYGLDIDNEGNIFVADTFNNRILILDSSGNLLLEFGSLGSDPGLFAFPRDVSVDEERDIFVADTGNYRIQKFDFQGNYRNSIGGFIEFLTPQKVALDDSGRLYVIDSNTNRLQIYDVTQFITGIHGPATPFSPDGDGFEDDALIEYRLPEPATVTIKVYNEDGELVRDLVSGELRGRQENWEIWDGRDNNGGLLGAGTYIIKVNAENGNGYMAPQQTIRVAVWYPSGLISGSVADQNGPVSGAVVSDGVRQTTSDLMGEYIIRNVPAGVFAVTASKALCTGSPTVVNLADGEQAGGIDFLLGCTSSGGLLGEIYGTVTGCGGPVEGATVTNGTCSVATDAQGRYRLSDIPLGSYLVTAKKYGCSDVAQTVIL
ncbi:MAG: carboxypeptidase regulatory-like domain-containing protein [Pseudomonadota bacterium]